MTYAFTFDASACSGCKACQVACKDKNNLPAGVLWRRVYEISGGSWQRYGDAWVTDVFAYNLSIACNHCVHPKCAGVCPTDAYVTREDGIVYIDETKCIGCGYCSWACPYAAPRFNPEQGKVGKCNFCYDNIDAGLPPACVAACPLRVLDMIEISEPRPDWIDRQLSDSEKLWELPGMEHPFPLPNFSRTGPHLAIKPHAGMRNRQEKVVSNREEISSVNQKFEELPLVAFTLLGQMAAGMAVYSFFSGSLSLPLLVTLGGLIALAGLASLLHLGAPENAWRAITHLKKSWLSREILMYMLFAGSWLIALASPGVGRLPLALSGTGLVYSMAQVYRLRSIAAWNSKRTLLSFALSAFLLGGLGMRVLNLFIDTKSSANALFLLLVILGIALWASLTDPAPTRQTEIRLRSGLIGLAVFGVLAMLFDTTAFGEWVSVPVFGVTLIEEGIGRWQFYRHLHKRAL